MALHDLERLYRARESLKSLVNAYVLHNGQRYYPVSADGGLAGLVTMTDLPRSEWETGLLRMP